MKQQAIITVKDLYTYFYSNKRCNKVLNGISFELYKGRTLCIVGESGCGKSVTAACIMQLLPELSRIESGSILITVTRAIFESTSWSAMGKRCALCVGTTWR